MNRGFNIFNIAGYFGTGTAISYDYPVGWSQFSASPQAQLFTYSRNLEIIGYRLSSSFTRETAFTNVSGTLAMSLVINRATDLINQTTGYSGALDTHLYYHDVVAYPNYAGQQHSGMMFTPSYTIRLPANQPIGIFVSLPIGSNPADSAMMFVSLYTLIAS